MTEAKKKVAKKKTAKKKASGTEVAEVQNKAVGMPLDFSADAGAGLEGADKDSFAIPFLSVVQKMSPQVDEDDPMFMPEAKAGMFLNSVTNELFDGKEGVIFIPCAFQRRMIRWGPRGSEEGGFKGEMMPEEAAQLEANNELIRSEGKLYFPLEDGKVKPKKCDVLNDTRNHFGLLLDKETGEFTRVLLSLNSTQIKKSKQLVSLLSDLKVDGPNGKITPPTFAVQVEITTLSESNEKGSWHGVKVKIDELVSSQAVYDAAKEFHSQIAEGKATVNYDAAAPEPKEGF